MPGRLALLPALLATQTLTLGHAENFCGGPSCLAGNNFNGDALLQIKTTKTHSESDSDDTDDDKLSREQACADQSNCLCSKMCFIYGDPHWIAFDMVDRYQDTSVRRTTEVVWAVKSSDIKIQVLAVGSGGNTAGIAVTGNFINNHKLVVERTEDKRHNSEAKVTWDNEEILQSRGDMFKQDVSEGRKVQLEHLESASPDPEDFEKVGWAGEAKDRFNQDGQYKLTLPGVVIYVSRYDHLSIIIKMHAASGGQDGACGNFDGKENDDWNSVVERMGGESELVVNKNSDENLFKGSSHLSFSDLGTMNRQSHLHHDRENRQSHLHHDREKTMGDFCDDAEFKAKAQKVCDEVKEEPFHGDCIKDVCTTGDLDIEGDHFAAEVLGSMAEHEE